MPIEKIVRGELITAAYLNRIGRSVNTLERSVNPPKQVNKPTSGDVQNQSAADQEAVETAPPSTYTETGRNTSLVQVFDQNETNYAEVTRIETITFVNGNGEELSLSFTNIG